MYLEVRSKVEVICWKLEHKCGFMKLFCTYVIMLNAIETVNAIQHVLEIKMIYQYMYIEIYKLNHFSAMLENSAVSDGGFEWLRVLRYHMDIQNVLRAKTEAVEVKGQSQSVQSVRSRTQQKRLSLIGNKLRIEPTIGKA